MAEPKPKKQKFSIAKTNNKRKEVAIDGHKCARCDADITLDEIKSICVDEKGNCSINNDKYIREALPYLNKYRAKAGLDTCMAKAHFLALICYASRFEDLEENFDLYAHKLIANYDVFTSDSFPAQGKKQSSSSRVEKAELWGKLRPNDPPVSLAKQKNIANFIYGNKDIKEEEKEAATEENYKYRGRGFLKVFGKSNYQQITDHFNNTMQLEGKKLEINWTQNYEDLATNPRDAILCALAFWGVNDLSNTAVRSSEACIKKIITTLNCPNTVLAEKKHFFNKAVEVLNSSACPKAKLQKKADETGTVIVVSGTETKKEKDYAQSMYWTLYKTTIYNNMSLEHYHYLKEAGFLAISHNDDNVFYLCRDAHKPKKQGRSSNRYGSYNEAPPGEYYLIPGASSWQDYKMYLSDDGKTFSIKGYGNHGARSDIAIHQFSPSGSEGCLTFNEDTDDKKNNTSLSVREFIAKIPNLDNKDAPVRIIIEERQVTEETWEGGYSGIKWVGILPEK